MFRPRTERLLRHILHGTYKQIPKWSVSLQNEKDSNTCIDRASLTFYSRVNRKLQRESRLSYESRSLVISNISAVSVECLQSM
jgi:hypothetical protein